MRIRIITECLYLVLVQIVEEKFHNQESQHISIYFWGVLNLVQKSINKAVCWAVHNLKDQIWFFKIDMGCLNCLLIFYVDLFVTNLTYCLHLSAQVMQQIILYAAHYMLST